MSDDAAERAELEAEDDGIFDDFDAETDNDDVVEQTAAEIAAAVEAFGLTPKETGTLHEGPDPE